MVAPTQQQSNDRDEIVVRTPYAVGRLSALRWEDEILLSATGLAHLAVEARGARRIRRGPAGWQEAGSDGVWSDVAKVPLGESVWFRLAPDWRLTVPGPVGPTPIEQGARRVTLVVAAPADRVAPSLSVVPDQRRPA